MLITKEFRFEAAHVLPRHPGKCSRLHGHSWVLRVSVEGEVNPETGFVMDYANLTAEVAPFVKALDHTFLGQMTSLPYLDEKHYCSLFSSSFYPSSENILLALGGMLPNDLNWSKLELEETCTSAAVLTRGEYNRITQSSEPSGSSSSS